MPLKLTPYDPVAALRMRAMASVEALRAEHAAQQDPGVLVTTDWETRAKVNRSKYRARRK